MGIPNKILVGQNPSLVDGVYSDDYLRALNEFASVDEVFGEKKQAIAEGERNAVAMIVMDTLGKSEYEQHLVALVMRAAKAGEWRAVERTTIWGLDRVVEKYYGHVTKFEDKTFLLPSATYLAYCKENL